MLFEEHRKRFEVSTGTPPSSPMIDTDACSNYPRTRKRYRQGNPLCTRPPRYSPYRWLLREHTPKKATTIYSRLHGTACPRVEFSRLASRTRSGRVGRFASCMEGDAAGDHLAASRCQGTLRKRVSYPADNARCEQTEAIHPRALGCPDRVRESHCVTVLFF